MAAEQYLQQALDAFDFGGKIAETARFGSGHINDTFCVRTQPGEDPCRRFILQRISRSAFHHPEQVMANIVGVTSYLKKEIAAQGGDPDRETLSLCAARDGSYFHTDPEGGRLAGLPLFGGHRLPPVRRHPPALCRLGPGLRQVPADAQGLPGGHPV